jgi:hypothetical protein
MSSAPPYGIAPEAPEQPRLHHNRDIDIIIKLLRDSKIHSGIHRLTSALPCT